VKRQREKDLRQAQRLEKALEEKRVGLKKKLEWRPPVVEEPGYGYGDGREVALDVTLETGEVMKVLSEDERGSMLKELEKTESYLEQVRAEIMAHGGTTSSQVTSPTMSEQNRPPLPASPAALLPLSLLVPPPSFSNLGLVPKEQSRKEENTEANPPSMYRNPEMMTAKERVMARNQFLRSNTDIFGEGPSRSSAQRRPEVAVKRSANLLDLGLFNSPARMELEPARRPSDSRDVDQSSGDPNVVRFFS
jgi:hypothetical protein